jgi:hypothetical protein
LERNYFNFAGQGMELPHSQRASEAFMPLAEVEKVHWGNVPEKEAFF